ncbi:hypothetical protein L5515_018133 [Caenorhabditis briggsae]|uniref:Peptidase M13 C-terminal domain-containing protein n=1 Tax=Caenorhabditis briggsae TaxID=6238 RepID=A0AAE9FF16_CAEBR|nr:hypothetical protein L5515_018133 [Caenorhabditis briggsae]
MKLLLLYFPILVVSDYAEEVKQYIDHSVDPCDNFYRHACRVGGPEYFPLAIVMRELEEVLGKYSPKVYPEFADIQNDLENSTKVESFSEMVVNIYKSVCESKQNVSDYLTGIEELLFGGEECLSHFCLNHLVQDSNCGRVAEHIQNVLKTTNMLTGTETFEDSLRKIPILIKEVERRNAVWGDDGLSRASEFDQYFLQMKDATAELIMATPWVRNHNVSEMIVSVLEKLYVENAVETSKQNLVKILKDMNSVYAQCRKRYNTVPNSLIVQFCMVYAYHVTGSEFKLQEKGADFLKEIMAGGTLYPGIKVGYQWYHIFQHSDNRASKLGSPGFTIAHELSHALIKGANFDILSYFSNEARNCIQDQYKSTCKEFDEGGCRITEKRFEENGADVFGFEIIWSMFEEQFLKRQKRSENIEASEDLKQFFYSSASNLCFGEKRVENFRDDHSPANVRINALVNHPAFQVAFQCSDDSRMMKSKTKHCSVYGQNAPPNRRHFVSTH